MPEGQLVSLHGSLQGGQRHLEPGGQFRHMSHVLIGPLQGKAIGKISFQYLGDQVARGIAGSRSCHQDLSQFFWGQPHFPPQGHQFAKSSRTDIQGTVVDHLGQLPAATFSHIQDGAPHCFQEGLHLPEGVFPSSHHDGQCPVLCLGLVPGNRRIQIVYASFAAKAGQFPGFQIAQGTAVHQDRPRFQIFQQPFFS